MKQILVSGAIILRTNPTTGKKEIFATQRGYGDYKDGWEIPGGKLEPGETPEACIVREIREELVTEIKTEKVPQGQTKPYTSKKNSNSNDIDHFELL